MEPLISIITVTFNCRELLGATLDSVQRQRFPLAEHIIVDGASTDGTVDLVRRHEAQLGAWISEPDKGIYDAMNKGLRMARGEYVLFLNAGDRFYTDDTLRQVFDQDPPAGPAGRPDIYYGQTKLIAPGGRIIGDRRLRAPEQLNWRSFRYGMLVCHQSFIVRRALAPGYDLSWRICADIDWCIRCMKAARNIGYTHGYISCFLEGGFSRQQEKKAWKERFAIMKKHYGLASTLLSHVYIAFRFLRQRTGLRRRGPMLRNNGTA